MYKYFFILILAIGFMKSPVAAQGFGIGPQLGIQKAKDADKSKLMYGAAARLKLTPALGVEGSINYRQESYADGNVKVKTWPVMVTGLFYPLPIVYGAVGFGWYNTTIDYSDELNTVVKDETSQNVGWHFGGGAEIPLGPGATLTGDIRYVFLNYDFKEVPGTGDTNSNFYVITIGLLFGL